MSAATVPFVDLALQHREIANEVRAALDALVARSAFILGDAVTSFERAFAAAVGVRHCVGVGSGTDALELALRSLGIGPGSEVILPANTFMATPMAVLRAGATPVIVDCDAETHLIDPQGVSARVSKRTAAVIPVHLYGQMAPMEEIAAISTRADVAIIEDAAQAHGARRNGVAAGAAGRIAGTSFYPAKNLGAWGDGGAVLTDDDALAAAVRRLRNYGSEEKYEHPVPGFNSRLDALQAVVLAAKLRHLARWNAERRAAGRRYDELLDGARDVRLPRTLPGNEHVDHLYVVRVPQRDDVRQRLRADGVEAGVHYPKPVHLHGALAMLGHGPGDFPNAERAAAEVLSLPMFPGITAEQQRHVADSLRKAVAA